LQVKSPDKAGEQILLSLDQESLRPQWLQHFPCCHLEWLPLDSGKKFLLKVAVSVSKPRKLVTVLTSSKKDISVVY
jgi:hypothetical protein